MKLKRLKLNKPHFQTGEDLKKLLIENGASIQSHYQASNLIDDEIYNVLIWSYLEKCEADIPRHYGLQDSIITNGNLTYIIMFSLEKEKRIQRRIENNKTVMNAIVDAFLDQDDENPLTVKNLTEKTGYSLNAVSDACKRLLLEKRIEKIKVSGLKFKSPRPEVSYQISEGLTL